MRTYTKKLPSVSFWEKVEKTGSCWNWTASLFKNGYGQFWAWGMKWYAHRFSYALHNDVLVTDMTINHLCKNRKCVNPAHLEQITRGENTLHKDSQSPSAINKRKTQCPRGHEYNGINTWVEKNGTRHCRPCNTINKRLQRKR